jgi:Flp pilus assembly pilin Flp
MHSRHNRSAVTSHEKWWHDQSGIEGIEVALITGLVVIIILATIPLAAGGVDTVISSLANELTNAGNAIN